MAVLLGETGLTTHTEYALPEEIESEEYVAKSTGVVTQITFPIATGIEGTGTTIEVGIWEDSAGTPGTLLCAQKATISAGSTATISITGGPTLTEGHVYHIGYLNQSGAGQRVYYYYGATSAGEHRHRAQGVKKLSESISWKTETTLSMQLAGEGTLSALPIQRPPLRITIKGNTPRLKVRSANQGLTIKPGPPPKKVTVKTNTPGIKIKPGPPPKKVTII